MGRRHRPAAAVRGWRGFRICLRNSNSTSIWLSEYATRLIELAQAEQLRLMGFVDVDKWYDENKQQLLAVLCNAPYVTQLE